VVLFYKYHCDGRCLSRDLNAEANILDIQYTNTYTIGVDGKGKLTLLKDAERVIDDRCQVLNAPNVVILGGVPGANNFANEINKNKQKEITDLANSLNSNDISA
jgi:hypothetical protein